MPWIYSTNIKGPPGTPGPIGPSGLTQVFISDTPPANPQHGNLWWESDTGDTFIYYDDGNSQQWVQINIDPLVLSAPIYSPAFMGDPTTPTPPVNDNDLSIANTAWVNLQGYAKIVDVPNTTFAVWPSGTLRSLKQRATDTYCILDAPGSPDPTGVNDSTAALQAMAASGINVEITNGAFLCTQRLIIGDGVIWRGVGGVDYLFHAHSRIIFDGTGAKIEQLVGDFTSPIAVANPSAGDPYLIDSGTRGNTYRMLDLSSAFSAAIILGKASGLIGLGIYPEFNGLAGYVTDTNMGLSDDWDVGVWGRNADSWRIENCAIMGHWRKAAVLITNSAVAGDTRIPSAQYGQALDSYFQGFCGVSLRSPNANIGAWGFAGTDFVNCEFRSLDHQSGYMATSSMLTTPFSQPSACLEMGGATMRGVEFLHSSWQVRDDICAAFHNAGETLFNGCYMEGKNIKVNGAWMGDGAGGRMVAANTSSVRFRNHTKYSIDHSPWQRTDVGLRPGRYVTVNSGVFNPTFSDDDDFDRQKTAPWTGPRLRGSGQGWRVLNNDGSKALLSVSEEGFVRAPVTYSGITADIPNNGVVSIPTPKTGGFCAITFCGSVISDDAGFAEDSRSGLIFYDTAAPSMSCSKYAGGANFAALGSDLTGSTGVAGNVTVGVISGNLRIENRQGNASMVRYFFFG